MYLHILESPKTENYIFSGWSLCMYVRGLQGPHFSGPSPARPSWLHSRPGPARSKEKNFVQGLARPEREIEISARARLCPNQMQNFCPEPARPIFFSDLDPDHLVLRKFKMSTNNKRIFFADGLLFRNLLKQLI